MIPTVHSTTWLALVLFSALLLCGGNPETGLNFPMHGRGDGEASSSLMIIGIRFVGPSAFDRRENAIGAIRCEIFARVTLPALVKTIKSETAPKKKWARLHVVLINDSAILEPTCARVVANSQRLLGDKLSFASSTRMYFSQSLATTLEDSDYVYFSRLDTDDAFLPSTPAAIHSAFAISGMPFAIISPYWGNLYYLPAGNDSCGEISYNTNLRRYPVLQTSAFHKRAFMDVMKLDKEADLEKFFSSSTGMRSLPYHYPHLDVEKPFEIFNGVNWTCSSIQDCILNVNTWDVNGAPGIIYTQTGLQSSLVRRGWTQTDHLKWYSMFVKGAKDPPACQTLEYYGIDPRQIQELRVMIA